MKMDQSTEPPVHSMIKQFHDLLQSEGISDDADQEWEKLDYPDPSELPRSVPPHECNAEPAIFATQPDNDNMKRKTPKNRKVPLGVKKHVWRESLKQTERNLGLRPRAFDFEDYASMSSPNDSWSKQLETQAMIDSARHNAKFPEAISVSVPPRWALENQPIFISIDVECYERNKSKITEVGFGYLDVEDLVGTAPGTDAKNWRSAVRSRHLRVIDHLHLVNREFVHGCGDRFNFGDSEYVHLDYLHSKIAACLRVPFGRFTDDAHVLPKDTSNDTETSRNIVLVGHDIAADIRFLKAAGCDITNMANLRIVDTSDIHRSFTHTKEPSSLGHVLSEFDIDAWHLHNAGNDATYTMWAMLAIAVRSASGRRVLPVEKFWDNTPINDDSKAQDSWN